MADTNPAQNEAIVIFRNDPDLEDLESNCSIMDNQSIPPAPASLPDSDDDVEPHVPQPSAFEFSPHRGQKYMRKKISAIFPFSPEESFVNATTTTNTSTRSTLLTEDRLSFQGKLSRTTSFMEELEHQLSKAVLKKQLSERGMIQVDAHDNNPHHRSLKFSSRICVVFYGFCLFFLFAFAVLCSILVIFVYQRNYLFQTETAQNYTSPDYVLQTSEITTPLPPLYKVLLIGDSLNRRPFTFWDLGGRLQRAVPDYRLQIYDRSRDSSYISLVAANVEQDVKVDADIALLFWDTDVSSIDEENLNSDEIADLVDTYISNVNFVVETVKASGVKHIAMAGPCLLGEQYYFELGYLTQRSQFDGKNDMLDRYRDLNAEIARNLTIDYIDLRDRFLEELPDWWPLAKYYLTVDGEHPNDAGTELLVEAYSDQIYKWLPVAPPTASS